VRHLILVGLVCLLGPVAVARANVTWTGGASTSGWKQAGNWVSGVEPGSGSDLSFPELTSCSVTTETCYSSNNDLGALAVDSLTVDDNDGYKLTGDGLTVGAGGITAQSYSAGGGAAATIGNTLTLQASQAWNFTGNGLGAQGLDVTSAVTGTGDALTINFADTALLEFGDAVDLGAITANTTAPGATGVIDLYSANGSLDGTGVTLNPGIDLDVDAPAAQAGQLASNGAVITVGGGNSPDGTLSVSGAVTLDSASTFNTYIDQNGDVPSSSYAQLAASGNITLNGSLNLREGFQNGTSNCGLVPGDTATLIATGGSLSGTFSQVPNDSLVPMTASCNVGSLTAPEARIDYTPNAVTATVVTPTSITLAASPSAAATNQPVTLTATISPTADVGAPSGTQGTVAFLNNGVQIPGCAAEPVSVSGTGFVATCTTTFTPGEKSPTASYSGGPDYLRPSTNASTTLAVGLESTSTSIGASNPNAQAGAPVSLTAAVSPADAGPVVPTGTVEFKQDGAPISGCAGQPLTPSATASCSTSFAAGTHSVTAVYSGDSNFIGSTSAVQLVTASAPQTSTTPPPRPSPSATTVAATAISKTSATLRGVVDTAGAAVSWQFELGRGAAYTKRSAVQTLGSGRGSVPVSATVSGLAPATRYRFVLVVMQASPATSAFGSPLSFTTQPNGVLLMTARRLAVTRGSVRVPESCTSAQACSGRFSITVGRSSCAVASYHVRAHTMATVGGALSRSCITRLRAASGHRLSATFSTAPQTGQLPVRKTVALALG
jgi:hypothetical protein